LTEPPGSCNPGAFDYRAYLFRRQIHWLGETERWKEILVLSTARIIRLSAGQVELYGAVAGYFPGMLLG
jgi:hypothetical protein